MPAGEAVWVRHLAGAACGDLPSEAKPQSLAVHGLRAAPLHLTASEHGCAGVQAWQSSCSAPRLGMLCTDGRDQ